LFGYAGITGSLLAVAILAGGATSQNSRKSPEIYPCAVICPAVSRDLFRVTAMFRLMYGRGGRPLRLA
jgi:hypothetical protein